MSQGDVRVEEADVDHPALVAGPDGAQVVLIFADRRELRVGARRRKDVAARSAPRCRSVLEDLQRQLPLAGLRVLSSEWSGPTPT